jgi:hypothetical protein
MSIIVDIALATICFTYNGTEECHSALLGAKNSPTPVGEFVVDRHPVRQKGYGGDVLKFYETDKAIWAIHRVFLLNSQRRAERLKSDNLKDKFITNGCINVDPTVYEKLIDCCSDSKLIIR